MRVPFCAVAAILLAGMAGCSAPVSRAGLPASTPRAPAFVRVKVTEAGTTSIRNVPLEEYVRATIISEFAPPSGETADVERMFEVQAIISRSYALAHLSRHAREGYDLCSTTHCQLYQPARLATSRWAPAAAESAARTAGQVLWYRGAPADAVFHADCGGRTSRSTDIWAGVALPYLAGAVDDGPAQAAHSIWQFDAPLAEVREALNKDPRTRIGARLDGITVLDRDAVGRAERLALHAAHDRIISGEDFREVLSRAFGARSVRSTWLEIRRDRDLLHFEGRGFGHGVGLCQAGAVARLRAGARISAVLQHYFPGTSIVTLG